MGEDVDEDGYSIGLFAWNWREGTYEPSTWLLDYGLDPDPDLEDLAERRLLEVRSLHRADGSAQIGMTSGRMLPFEANQAERRALMGEGRRKVDRRRDAKEGDA